MSLVNRSIMGSLLDTEGSYTRTKIQRVHTLGPRYRRSIHWSIKACLHMTPWHVLWCKHNTFCVSCLNPTTHRYGVHKCFLLSGATFCPLAIHVPLKTQNHATEITGVNKPLLKANIRTLIQTVNVNYQSRRCIARLISEVNHCWW